MTVMGMLSKAELKTHTDAIFLQQVKAGVQLT